MALAKARGVDKGRPRPLPPDVVVTLRQRVAAGEAKVCIAHDLGISRSTLYADLRTWALQSRGQTGASWRDASWLSPNTASKARRHASTAAVGSSASRHRATSG